MHIILLFKRRETLPIIIIPNFLDMDIKQEFLCVAMDEPAENLATKGKSGRRKTKHIPPLDDPVC